MVSTFTLLCPHHHHHPQSSSSCTSVPIKPRLPLLQPLAPPSTFCLYKSDCSRDLLEVTHTVSVFLCLAHSIEHNVLEVHPHCGRCQNVLPFRGWIIFHCVSRPRFVCPFIRQWTLGLFPLRPLWITLMRTWMYKYLFKTLFSILLKIYPEVELLDGN